MQRLKRCRKGQAFGLIIEVPPRMPALRTVVLGFTFSQPSQDQLPANAHPRRQQVITPVPGCSTQVGDSMAFPHSVFSLAQPLLLQAFGGMNQQLRDLSL